MSAAASISARAGGLSATLSFELDPAASGLAAGACQGLHADGSDADQRAAKDLLTAAAAAAPGLHAILLQTQTTVELSSAELLGKEVEFARDAAGGAR